MIYYVDGFCLGDNPSPTGGGYTIVVFDGETALRLVCQEVIRPGMTNNEAELLAIYHASEMAQPLDEIISDSMCALAWVRKGKCHARPDLNKYASGAQQNVLTKDLNLHYESRYSNLAGLYNDKVIEVKNESIIEKKKLRKNQQKRYRFKKKQASLYDCEMF